MYGSFGRLITVKKPVLKKASTFLLYISAGFIYSIVDRGPTLFTNKLIEGYMY